MDVAEAPNKTNTNENPITKKIVLMTTFHGWACALSRVLISSIETPEMNERYPGINGKTHGDMKDKNPARMAVGISTVG